MQLDNSDDNKEFDRYTDTGYEEDCVINGDENHRWEKTNDKEGNYQIYKSQVNHKSYVYNHDLNKYVELYYYRQQNYGNSRPRLQMRQRQRQHRQPPVNLTQSQLNQFNNVNNKSRLKPPIPTSVSISSGQYWNIKERFPGLYNQQSFDTMSMFSTSSTTSILRMDPEELRKLEENVSSMNKFVESLSLDKIKLDDDSSDDEESKSGEEDDESEESDDNWPLHHTDVEEINKLRQKVKKDQEKIRRKKMYKNKLKIMTSEINNKNDKISELKKLNKNLENKLIVIKKDDKEVDRLKKESNVLKDQLKNAQVENNKLTKENNNYISTLKDISNNNNSEFEKLKLRTKVLIEKKKSEYKAIVEQWKKANGLLNTQLDQLKLKTVERNEEIKLKEQEFKEKEKLLKEAKRGKKKMERYKRERDDARAKVRQLEKNIIDLDNKLDSAENRIQELEDDVKQKELNNNNNNQLDDSSSGNNINDDNIKKRESINDDTSKKDDDTSKKDNNNNNNNKDENEVEYFDHEEDIPINGGNTNDVLGEILDDDEELEKPPNN